MDMQTTPFRVYRGLSGKRFNTVSYVRRRGQPLGAISIHFSDLSEEEAAAITEAFETVLPGLVPDTVTDMQRESTT